MSTKDRDTHIADALARTLQGTGAVIEDVVSQAAGKRRLLRITVARDLAGLPEGDHTSRVEPLTLDEIADATRVIGEALDDQSLMGEQPYVLEVSSFGLDQPLSKPEHFRRNVGRLVALNLEDDETLTGRVLAADGMGVTVAETDSGDEIRVEFDQVRRARVEVEFSRRDEEEN